MTRRVRKTLPGVVLLPDLAASVAALRSWRASHAAHAVLIVATTALRASTLPSPACGRRSRCGSSTSAASLPTRSSRRARVAGGSPLGCRGLSALPALYFGIVLVLCLLYFAVAWFWRARRPHDVQHRSARDAAPVLARIPGARRRGAADDALSLARAGPGARARRRSGAAAARRALQRRRVGAAARAS